AGLDDRRGNRIVPAARAQGADLALVVAAGEADGVAAEGGVVEFGFGEIGHSMLPLLSPYPLGRGVGVRVGRNGERSTSVDVATSRLFIRHSSAAPSS